MNHTQKQWMPFFILFSLLCLLGYELFFTKQTELPSALLGKTLPRFKLPLLLNKDSYFSNQDLYGKLSLLNVWASWCRACALEQPMLLKIKNEYQIPIYSINYKDSPTEAAAWLNTNGNPYTLIGDDSNGDTTIDLGVYGTPETFIISAEGTILYRHVGMITQAIWDNTLYPLLKKYGSSA